MLNNLKLAFQVWFLFSVDISKWLPDIFMRKYIRHGQMMFTKAGQGLAGVCDTVAYFYKWLEFSTNGFFFWFFFGGGVHFLIWLKLNFSFCSPLLWLLFLSPSMGLPSAQWLRIETESQPCLLLPIPHLRILLPYLENTPRIYPPITMSTHTTMLHCLSPDPLQKP